MRIIHGFAVAVGAAAVIICASPCLMCESFQYEARGKRDPFVPLVGVSKPVVSRLEDITSVEDIKVEGIAVGAGGRKIAILNGEALKESDKVGDIQLKNVHKKSVTILMSGKSYDLYLPGEEGGAKGEK